MRKYYQRQLLDIMKTIKVANSLIERYIKNEQYEEALELLVECHEGAVNIGNSIENLEGKDTITVTYLEEYCDMLYEAGIAIKEGKEKSKNLKLIHNQIIKVENSIINDIKAYYLEVVFLPYKASMWDSMESVWIKAKEDIECKAYVVPIPYFDRLKDGGLGQMHYEGNQYPDYVPIEDYRSFNIEAKHPDIIFIHNPYDNGNYVTTVHPDYYSQRLKNYTDLLAYIPYFVVSGDVSEHFCTCAGVLFADKVFVQSEKVRNTYVRVFQEFDKKHNLIAKFGNPESKFLAMGSPKFDKVINSKPIDYPLPVIWREKIERPDGSEKTIVLYNTSVGAILEGNEDYIRKLQNVLDLFRNRDDTVLWWRPHPLSETTYDTMRPQLLEEYKQIVEDYKKEGFGIYDDTADLHRAIQRSTLLYTDYSSLVPMYQCTGKPVLLQKIKRTIDYLTFESIFDDGEWFWASAININGLFKIDKRTLKAKYTGMFKGEAFSGRLFADIVKHGRKLYFIPFSAQSMAIYDLETGEFSSVGIEVPKTDIVPKYDPENKFAFAVSYSDSIYLFPRTYPAVVKYNCITEEVSILNECMRPLRDSIVDNRYSYFNNGLVDGQYVTMFSPRTKSIVRFDMGNDRLYVLERIMTEHVYSRIEFDEENYWLIPYSDGTPVLKYNAKTKEKKFINEFPDDLRNGRRYLTCSTILDGCLYMLTGATNRKSIKLNLSTNEIRVFEEFSSDASTGEPEIEQWKYLFLKSIGNRLYSFDGSTGEFIEYDTVSGNIRKENIIVDSNDEEGALKLLETYLLRSICEESGQYVLKESEYVNLNNLIDYLNKNNIKESIESMCLNTFGVNKNYTLEGTAGESIFLNCKEAVMSL